MLVVSLWLNSMVLQVWLVCLFGGMWVRQSFLVLSLLGLHLEKHCLSILDGECTLGEWVQIHPSSSLNWSFLLFVIPHPWVNPAHDAEEMMGLARVALWERSHARAYLGNCNGLMRCGDISRQIWAVGIRLQRSILEPLCCIKRMGIRCVSHDWSWLLPKTNLMKA